MEDSIICGLVGTASVNIYQTDVKIFKQLLEVDQLRGRDSTGVTITGSLGTHYMKRAVNASEMLDSRSFSNWINTAAGDYAIMGHNRAATRGGVNNDNAHPFIHGDIVMMHNGTLVSRSQLPDASHQVDSESVCHALSVLTPKEVCRKLDGAFALSWIDMKENTLNFMRNDERTLFMCSDIKEETIYWASEREMLHWILKRNDMTYKNMSLIKPGVHVKVQLGEAALTISTEQYELMPERKWSTSVKKYGTTISTTTTTRSLPAPTGVTGSGKPDQKRVDRINKTLEGTDLVYGDEVMFMLDKHEKYNPHTSNGRCVGACIEDGFLTVHVPMVEEGLYESDDIVYQGTIDGATIDAETTMPILIIDAEHAAVLYDLKVKKDFDEFTEAYDYNFEWKGVTKEPDDELNELYTIGNCRDCLRPLSNEEVYTCDWDGSGNPICNSCSITQRFGGVASV